MAERDKKERDFLQMQQEAIRRVRDMQARARQTLEDAGVPLEPAEPPDAPHMESPSHAPEPEAEPVDDPPANDDPPQEPRMSHHEPQMPFHLALDSEQIMLLLIIYLLYKDQGDQYLMMALAYLLLT